MDSDIAEQMLSKSSRKQQRHDTRVPDVPSGGLPEFPNTEPMEMGPHTVLPHVGSVAQAVPEPVVPAAMVIPPSTLAPSLWGKGDPPASIMGKWPHPFGKTKTRQHPWHQACDVNTVEFQNALQIARVIKGTEHTLGQLADAMQVWTLNESTCPPAISQLPDCTLHLHDVDFLHMAEKYFAKRRQQSLQAPILEAIRLE